MIGIWVWRAEREARKKESCGFSPDDRDLGLARDIVDVGSGVNTRFQSR